MERVAVVTPVHGPQLNQDEELSLYHLETVLGRYPRFLMIPDGLGFERAGFHLLTLAPEHFASRDAYSRLLLSAKFYELFAEYEFLLIYQLDSLVFRDELEQWCQAGYDYVGAPWLRQQSASGLGFSRGGNGGLSLRRLAACQAVLQSNRTPPWHQLFTVELADLEALPLWRRPLKRLSVLREARRGAVWYAAHYSLNEDRFWVDRAHLFYPPFRTAPADIALRFAFECAPRQAYELCGGQLPFGCHAWGRYDRAFWEPHLLRWPAN